MMEWEPILLVILTAAFAVAGAVLGWALKEIVALKAAYEGLRSRVDAEGCETKRRFDELTHWMKDIDKKLDRLLMGTK